MRLLRLLVGLIVRSGLRPADLEADALELAGDILDLLLVELVLERESLELGRLDPATLLGALDERAGLIALEQLLNLVLRQVGCVSPFGPAVGGSSRLRTLGQISWPCQSEPFDFVRFVSQ